MSLTAIVGPLIKLVRLIVEGASKSDDPQRDAKRKLEAEMVHKGMQEAARKALEGDER